MFLFGPGSQKAHLKDVIAVFFLRFGTSKGTSHLYDTNRRTFLVHFLQMFIFGRTFLESFQGQNGSFHDSFGPGRFQDPEKNLE